MCQDAIAFEREKNRKSENIVTRAGWGNVVAGNRYWRMEQERMCKICERNIEALKHSMENCTGVDRINTSVEEIPRDRRSEEVGALRVDRIEKDRRNKERGKGKERNGGRNTKD